MIILSGKNKKKIISKNVKEKELAKKKM